MENLDQAVNDYVLATYGDDVSVTAANMDMDRLRGLIEDAIQWAIEDYVDSVIGQMEGI